MRWVHTERGSFSLIAAVHMTQLIEKELLNLGASFFDSTLTRMSSVESQTFCTLGNR